MDQTTPPTAAELGISEGEYERILRDLRQRSGSVEPEVAPASRGSRWRRLPLAVFAIVIGLTLGPQLVSADPADREPTYAFLQTVEGEPVTYTSCRLIQVAVYPAGGPPDAEEMVREAVAQVRSATGLDIVVTGVFGGYAPNWNFAAAPVHPDDPISVSWQDDRAIAELTDHTAGLGGSRTVTSASGTKRFVAGTIALSRDYYAYLTERDDHAQAVAILLHEFGHVFGLNHVDSPDELMSETGSGMTAYGEGDLQGLRRLGQGPCI